MGGLTVRQTIPCLYRDKVSGKVNGKIGDEGVGGPATPGDEASPGLSPGMDRDKPSLPGQGPR